MIGIIGGSGVYEITQKADNCEKRVVKTDYGNVEVSILDIFSKKVAFLPRHASGHCIPPHKINFRANIDALKNLGVTKIIATNSVGSMNLDMPPGSFVIPDDFLDFSQNRVKTFYEDKVVHVDVTEPPALKRMLSVMKFPMGASPVLSVLLLVSSGCSKLSSTWLRALANLFPLPTRPWSCRSCTMKIPSTIWPRPIVTSAFKGFKTKPWSLTPSFVNSNSSGTIFCNFEA